MKKIATITCMLLLIVGSASVWAAALTACCPPEHHMATMGAADGCLAPACCVAPAPVPARHSGSGHLRVTAAVAAPGDAPVAATIRATVSIEEPRAGSSSPAASQTTPVLLS